MNDNAMTLIEFPEMTTVIAKDQSPYKPMPAYRRNGDARAEIVCCLKLTLGERLKILVTGRLWHCIWTFGQPVQPQRLTVDKPEMPRRQTGHGGFTPTPDWPEEILK